jgi:hypothetical protein
LDASFRVDRNAEEHVRLVSKPLSYGGGSRHVAEASARLGTLLGDRRKGNGAKSTEAWHTVLDDLMGKTWWRQEILAVDDAFTHEADAPHMLRARSTMQRKTGSDASIPVTGIQERIDRIHWYHEFDFGNAGARAS